MKGFKGVIQFTEEFELADGYLMVNSDLNTNVKVRPSTRGLPNSYQLDWPDGTWITMDVDEMVSVFNKGYIKIVKQDKDNV